MNNIKALLLSKISLVVTLITLLWIFFDTENRFVSHTDSHDRVIDTKSITNFHSYRFSEKDKTNLIRIYSQYNPDALDIKSKGITEKQQSEQHGYLTTVFAEDKKLKLKAVIKFNLANGTDKSPDYALIQVGNVNDTTQKIVKYYENDNVYGYRLTINNNTQVKLTKINNLGVKTIENNNEKENTSRVITLVMYQSPDGYSLSPELSKKN
tara:strand:- start:19434 stop:20063 length:630 start_codon:yes stop_codon:yes gene_type:complete